jgi:hypothetical protein
MTIITPTGKKNETKCSYDLYILFYLKYIKKQPQTQKIELLILA